MRKSKPISPQNIIGEGSRGNATATQKNSKSPLRGIRTRERPHPQDDPDENEPQQENQEEMEWANLSGAKSPAEGGELSSQEDMTEEKNDGSLHHQKMQQHPHSLDRIRLPLSPYQPPSAFQAPLTPTWLNANKDEKKVQCKPGILYLSSIPPGFNVSRTTSFFAQFGQLGRIFLRSDAKEKSKDGMSPCFKEGWLEFTSKRVAKEVAANLNNTQVGGKKRSQAHDVIWNIQYLSKFKWTQLSERQKIRHDVAQAKRDTDFSKMNFQRSKLLKRKPERESQSPTKVQRIYEFRQIGTDDAIPGSRSGEMDDIDSHPKVSEKEEVAKGMQSSPEKRETLSRIKSNGKTGLGRERDKREKATSLGNVFGVRD